MSASSHHSNGKTHRPQILGPDGQPYRGSHSDRASRLSEALDRKRTRLELLQTEAQLRAARIVKTRQKKLLESFDTGGWYGGVADTMSRMKTPDGDFIMPVSTANDVRYGDAFPFWRTWIEHARLRAASRLIYGMSPLVRGTIGGVGAYVIGEGMRSRAAPKRDDSPKPLLEAVQAWLDDWEKDNRWLTRQLECFIRRERDGEFFLRIFPQEDGWTVVRITEPMFIVEPPNMPYEIGKYGVITDPEDLYDVRGFWVAEDGLPSNGEQIPSSLMRQHKTTILDDYVKRGMPVISYDMLDYFKVVGRLLENMGTGAAIQAAIAFIRQHQTAPASAVADFAAGLGDYTQDRVLSDRGSTETVQRFDAGTVIDLDSGQEFVEAPFASNVQNFTSCVQAILRAVAVHYSAPEWISSADSSNNSYSSSLTAESPFVRRCKQEQTGFQGAFTWAVESALRHHCRVRRGFRADGRLWLWDEVRHYVDIQVTPPTVETRNRSEESQLNRTYIEMGVKSRQTVAQELGLDFEREERNNQQYETEHGEQGVPAKLRAGEGGGGPDDPMANIPGNHPAVHGIMGSNRDGDGLPDQGADALVGNILGQQQGGGAPAPQQQQPAQEQQQSAGGDQPEPGAGADDILADAGLDDLFGDLGLPDTAGDGEDAEPEKPGESNDLRATVGALNAVKELQAAVYGGELPREAAVQNAHLMLGFSREEAESLFPEAAPRNTQDDGGGEEDGAPEDGTAADVMSIFGG